MTDRCDRCGSRSGVEHATITDDSGGAFVGLCRACRDTVRTTRCAFCGGIARPTRKACSVFVEEDGTGAPICDPCRKQVAFRDEAAVREGSM